MAVKWSTAYSVGVEFGHPDYPKEPVSFGVIASSAASGGMVQVWLDSLDTGRLVAECPVGATGDWKKMQPFTAPTETVSGRHDVYLKFVGNGTEKLFHLQWVQFLTEGDTISSVTERSTGRPPQGPATLQNYPNPFNPSTRIDSPRPGKCS